MLRSVLLLLMTLLIVNHSVLADSDNKELTQTKMRLSGEKLFQNNCAVCHGGEGSGGVGIPLNMEDFLATTSNQYLKNTIRRGRPGRIMPAFSHLSDAQINEIVVYIRGWSEKIKAPQYSLETITGDVKKGQQIFEKICIHCHREKGIGAKGTGVTFSRPRDADILAPGIGNSAFLASAPDHMIKQVIMTGRKKTPMLSAKLMGLSENDVNNVVSYLRSLEKIEKDHSKSNRTSSVLVFESSYSVQETIKNIKQAAVGYNFRYIREQTLDKNFVLTEQQSDDHYLIYFCNFNFLNQALSIDPRIGMFLPFRATIVKQNDVVKVMTVNPEYLCSLFNNNELKQGCDFMSEQYTAILEESTL